MCLCMHAMRAQEMDKLSREQRKLAEREDRERRKMEEMRSKEDARLRTAQDREAKRLKDAADKERRAAERRAGVENKRRCAQAPPVIVHCNGAQPMWRLQIGKEI